MKKEIMVIILFILAATACAADDAPPILQTKDDICRDLRLRDQLRDQIICPHPDHELRVVMNDFDSNQWYCVCRQGIKG